jgi:hypothetical protein
MKRRPEAKRVKIESCSILTLGRPAHVSGDRYIDDQVIFKVDQASVP